MSASPMARQISENKAIPTRRVIIGDTSEIPCSYSSTPGGTLFSTTPGGTRIVYEKSFLMNLRNSPISKTPPQWDIPASILRGSPNSYANKQLSKKNTKYDKSVANGKPPRDDNFEQFQMDM